MTKFQPEDTVAISRPRRDESVCYRLTVELGPDEGDVFQGDGSAPSAVLIGTSEACQVRLRDPGVSRRHASVEVSHGDLRLRDINSTNGTTVDGILALEEGGLRATLINAVKRATERAKELAAG